MKIYKGYFRKRQHTCDNLFGLKYIERFTVKIKFSQNSNHIWFSHLLVANQVYTRKVNMQYSLSSFDFNSWSKIKFSTNIKIHYLFSSKIAYRY